jgi:hypothetical protein
MYIIKINNSGSLNITADSTVFTADSTELTADISNLDVSNMYVFSIIPRYFVDTVSVLFINELTKEETTQICQATDNKGLMNILFQYELKDNDLLDVTVYNNLNNDLLWRGKIGATSQNDIQNFKMNVPNNDNIIII